MVSQKDLVVLKSRLQMALTLALFFPVSLAAIFKNGDSTYVADQMTLKWGLVLVCLIVSYILVEYLSVVVTPRIVTWVKGLLILEIASLGYIFYVFGATFSSDVLKYYCFPNGNGRLWCLDHPAHNLALAGL